MNTKQQPKYTLLECVDKLDDLRLRLAFICNSVGQSSDWIDTAAASALGATVGSIWEEMGDVSKSVHAEVKRERA